MPSIYKKSPPAPEGGAFAMLDFFFKNLRLYLTNPESQIHKPQLVFLNLFLLWFLGFGICIFSL